MNYYEAKERISSILETSIVYFDVKEIKETNIEDVLIN